MQAVLGIAGSRREASAALAVDGRVVAAVSEDAFVKVPGVGYAQTGGSPLNAINACLEIAGLDPNDLSTVAVVKDAATTAEWCSGVRAVPVESIDPLHADAIQAIGCDRAAGIALIASIDPPELIAFAPEDGRVRAVCRAAGWEYLVRAAATLAAQLGAIGGHSFAMLDRLGSEGTQDFLSECAEAFQWKSDNNLSVCYDRIGRIVERLSDDITGGLSNPDSVNVRAQEARRNIAASFMAAVSDAVRGFSEHALRLSSASRLILGGELFENASLNTRLRDRLGERLSLTAVPGPRGRAIGACLSRSGLGDARYAGLALGPAFNDHAIKETLDNCRIDYVYEPDSSRLLGRVSNMLARGIVVGWFHGPAGFGSTSLGTRSILCDPSRAYVRENINGYLRRTAVSDPLPISLTEASAEKLFGAPIRSPYMLFRAPVPAAARDGVRAALDGSNHVQFHTVTPDQAAELCELLDVHSTRTSVPGLINLNLAGPGEPTACSPRDAVRTFYSTAIDALVIGRFLLMKDYWLLRSDLA